jgi:hypothetical protein
MTNYSEISRKKGDTKKHNPVDTLDVRGEKRSKDEKKIVIELNFYLG